MSWEPIDIPAMVYDYEVGFSSTAGSAAPDIMSFQSTKQHAHHRVMHGNIPDATRFYIIIKTISKSNIEGLTVINFKFYILCLFIKIVILLAEIGHIYRYVYHPSTSSRLQIIKFQILALPIKFEN
jgi:hypothetical protein